MPSARLQGYGVHRHVRPLDGLEHKLEVDPKGVIAAYGRPCV